jgi:hypothetical protein
MSALKKTRLKIKVFSWNYGSTSDEKEAKI